VYWIAFALAGGSLILSAATLYVVLGVRRSTRRAERAGNERLEILREQQERLALLHEERRMLRDRQSAPHGPKPQASTADALQDADEDQHQRPG
jgi:hypothetical protein